MAQVQLQLVFSETDKKRNRLRELKAAIKEQLESKQEFQEIKETSESLRARKKALKLAVDDDNKTECEEIERLEIDIKSQKQLISDVAIKDYLAGKEIKVTDNYGNVLEPVFSVKFVKTGDVEETKKGKAQLPERLDLE